MASSSSSSSVSDSENSVSTSTHPRKRQRISDESDHDASGSDSDDSESSQSDSDTSSEAEEEQVLSHAEKRRQKKKEKHAAKSADEPSGKKGQAKVQNTAELPPSKVPKRQNSIWVGNLSFKTTPASLRAFFEGVGEITRVHMPMKMATGGPEKGPRKENRGFAYVDFASPDAKIVAITMSENPLDGRRLLIKDGDDFKGRPAATAGADGADGASAKSMGHSKTAQKILSMQKQPPGPTLFLGNLGFETTEDTIRELFESHRAKEKEPAADGTENAKWIRKIRLGTFEDSGKCKGWAFVDFTSTEHATAALTNPRNHQLNGRKLVVEYASPEAVRRGGGGPPREKKEKGAEAGGRPRQFGTKRERPSRPRQDEGEGSGDGGEEGEGQGPPAKKQRVNAGDYKDRGRDKGGKGARPRSKPGAALAMARREDVSIVPSQGKKIVF